MNKLELLNKVNISCNNVETLLSYGDNSNIQYKQILAGDDLNNCIEDGWYMIQPNNIENISNVPKFENMPGVILVVSNILNGVKHITQTYMTTKDAFSKRSWNRVRIGGIWDNNWNMTEGILEAYSYISKLNDPFDINTIDCNINMYIHSSMIPSITNLPIGINGSFNLEVFIYGSIAIFKIEHMTTNVKYEKSLNIRTGLDDKQWGQTCGLVYMHNYISLGSIIDLNEMYNDCNFRINLNDATSVINKPKNLNNTFIFKSERSGDTSCQTIQTAHVGTIYTRWLWNVVGGIIVEDWRMIVADNINQYSIENEILELEIY